MVYKQVERFTKRLNSLQAGWTVYKQAEELTSRLKSLQAGWTVYKQAEQFTSRLNSLPAGWRANKPAERMAAQADEQCEVAKQVTWKVKSNMILLYRLPMRIPLTDGWTLFCGNLKPVDPLNVLQFHFRWVLKLLTSHKCHCSHPVHICDHTHCLTSFQ